MNEILWKTKEEWNFLKNKQMKWILKLKMFQIKFGLMLNVFLLGIWAVFILFKWKICRKPFKWQFKNDICHNSLVHFIPEWMRSYKLYSFNYRFSWLSRQTPNGFNELIEEIDEVKLFPCSFIFFVWHVSHDNNFSCFFLLLELLRTPHVYVVLIRGSDAHFWMFGNKVILQMLVKWKSKNKP